MLKWQKEVPEKTGYYWIKRKSAIPSDNIFPKIVYLELIKTIPYSCVTDPFVKEIGWLNRQQPCEFAGPLEEPNLT